MTQLVFLVEEASMAELLGGILPRMIPESVAFRCIPHEGKSDLEKSIPRKLKAWKNPEVSFVIVRDNDQGDCRSLKSRLQDLCAAGRRPESLVRIVCQHLEAWYLGDLAAVEKAYGRNDLRRLQEKSMYRDPDRQGSAKEVLRRLVPEYQQMAGARLIGEYLDVSANGPNQSKSFQVFLSGVRQLCK